MCFPFSRDNFSSNKFLKFSFLRAGIHISQFGDPIIVSSAAFPELCMGSVICTGQRQFLVHSTSELRGQ